MHVLYIAEAYSNPIITWDNLKTNLKSFQSPETSPMHENVEELTGLRSALNHQGLQCSIATVQSAVRA